MKRPLAYITAHWGDNEFENTENAAKYCRLVYEAGFSPRSFWTRSFTCWDWKIN